MTLSPLDAALKKLGKKDGEFGKLCKKHRTEIWAYRHRTRTPSYETAMRIQDALEGLGVEMSLEEIIYFKRTKKAA